MLNIAITFDYELFFGENLASYDEILFFPTERLLDTLDEHGEKATFFADVLSVYMHEKQGITEYCEKFIHQIQRMVQRGHDVQLHIHPNGLTAEYRDGQWVFDTDNYRIHTFGFSADKQISADWIIKWGKDFLESTLQRVDPNYTCIAYRAGGYCIQPHEELFRVLNRHGIWIDSSVALQQKSGSFNKYDYTDIPSERNGWWINNQRALTEEVSAGNADMYEVPVICTSRSLIRRLVHPNEEKTLRCGKPKGTVIGQTTVEPVHRSWFDKLKILLTYHRVKPMLTCDSLRYQAIHRELLKRAKRAKQEEYVALIGHPKMADEIWIANFDGLLRNLEKRQNLDVVTVSGIGCKIRKNGKKQN